MSRELLRANDIRFLDWANGLSTTDWATESLCAGWTNHDVLAHLVIGCTVAPTRVIGEMVSHRGSFDRANTDLACRLAGRRSPAGLLDEYAQLIHAPRGIGRIFPRRLLLGDHVIHELDIALALRRPSTIGADQLIAVLNTQVHTPNPFVPATARARGLRLHATDVQWRSGRGPEVTGSGAHLASVLAGRPSALRFLQGDGVDVLRTRIVFRSVTPVYR